MRASDFRLLFWLKISQCVFASSRCRTLNSQVRQRTDSSRSQDSRKYYRKRFFGYAMFFPHFRSLTLCLDNLSLALVVICDFVCSFLRSERLNANISCCTDVPSDRVHVRNAKRTAEKSGAHNGLAGEIKSSVTTCVFASIFFSFFHSSSSCSAAAAATALTMMKRLACIW